MKLPMPSSGDTNEPISDSPIMFGLLTGPIDYVIEKAKIFGHTGTLNTAFVPDRNAPIPSPLTPPSPTALEYRSQMRYLFMRQQLSRRLNIPAPRGLQPRSHSHAPKSSDAA